MPARRQRGFNSNKNNASKTLPSKASYEASPCIELVLRPSGDFLGAPSSTQREGGLRSLFLAGSATVRGELDTLQPLKKGRTRTAWFPSPQRRPPQQQRPRLGPVKVSNAAGPFPPLSHQQQHLYYTKATAEAAAALETAAEVLADTEIDRIAFTCPRSFFMVLSPRSLARAPTSACPSSNCT